jgi:hypothetical protein
MTTEHWDDIQPAAPLPRPTQKSILAAQLAEFRAHPGWPTLPEVERHAVLFFFDAHTYDRSYKGGAPDGTARRAWDVADRLGLSLPADILRPEPEPAPRQEDLDDAAWHAQWKAKMKAKMDAEAAAPRSQLPVSQAALDLEEEFRRKPVFQPYVDSETGLTIDQELDDNG